MAKNRSLNGVRSYKRTSQQKKEALSDIMNLPVPKPKQQKLDIGSTIAACSQQQIGMAPAQLSLQNCSNIIQYGSTLYVGMAQEKNGCPIKHEQNLMYSAALVRSFYEPYQSFSSVFINNKTVSVDRNHHWGTKAAIR